MRAAFYKLGFIAAFVSLAMIGLKQAGWLDLQSMRFYAVMLVIGLICGALVRGLFGRVER
ncbi:hypothetical protein U879_06120 [Defluviimonas sp. 20V17]|uniref:Uncharacterized protein n=1 Tax=Allgaiera indica TaxID=765699 RepID=A0AAN4UQ69_9RHOB|nr:hypothetical protein [Allgaiera indica]KDB04587.1 hypothetical protein U879_06120 [Defluviimonas sp. 20V17]GHD99764.1 hypothetical protein GCM10008024_08450 [Allgaiera indica]SDW19008.1 hypothetical protein SAMN05444006_10231 [Allgaiera indica]